MFEKFKLFINDDVIFMAILIVLVGFGSFLLGQQSVTDIVDNGTNKVSLLANAVATTDISQVIEEVIENKEEIVDIAKSSEITPANKPATKEKYVASKSGTKYHLLTCPGAKQIKEENKIYFDSAATAESAGYTPASNCPGL